MNSVEIRKLQKKDLDNGFLSSLDSLRKASDIKQEEAEKIFELVNLNPNHVIMVAVSDNRVVGSITLLIEPKFIHKGGLVGHIEDVVVDKRYQGKGIGEKLVNFALEYAKKQGCYKTILDCSDDVKPFYEKLGFKHHSSEMRFDY